ncbi:hypothetical protein [Thalassiella azotivora]
MYRYTTEPPSGTVDVTVVAPDTTREVRLGWWGGRRLVEAPESWGQTAGEWFDVGDSAPGTIDVPGLSALPDGVVPSATAAALEQRSRQAWLLDHDPGGSEFRYGSSVPAGPYLAAFGPPVQRLDEGTRTPLAESLLPTTVVLDRAGGLVQVEVDATRLLTLVLSLTTWEEGGLDVEYRVTLTVQPSTGPPQLPDPRTVRPLAVPD